MRARCIQPELLDGLSPEQAARNLHDLRRINRWFGGHLISKQLLSEMFQPSDTFSVLDVGAASGDLALTIGRRFPKATVVSCDLSASHLALAPRPKAVADAFRLPFRPRSFDVVHCSLFLHHFEDESVTQLLEAFASIACRAVVAVDLERHPLSRAFLPLTTSLFRWDAVTVHDGVRSVEAGFKPHELRTLAAGLPRVRVRRHAPWFRISLISTIA